jgi:hypothetical protein
MSLSVVVSLFLLISTSISSSADSPGWHSLFNGKDLSGWEVRCLEKDRHKEFWKASNGILLCDSMGRPDHDYVWLVSEEEFDDFELRLEFQAYRESPGNSGVQIRSRYDPSSSAPQGGWLDGPQIDIHPPAPWRIGLIYDETREERRWISPSLPDWNIEPSNGPDSWRFKYADEEDGWNDLRIVCEGSRIRTELNGIVMTDFDGTGILNNEAHLRHHVGMNGHIALQLHAGDELKIRFRNIRIRPIVQK